MAVVLSIAPSGLVVFLSPDILQANNTITDIYDTRVFTNSTKEFATVEINAAFLGAAVKDSLTTVGGVTPVNAINASNLIGVVAATTGTTSTTAINAIIDTHGVATIKAVTGTNGRNFVIGSVTTGYANTASSPLITGTTNTTALTIFGISRGSNWSSATACVINSDVCRGSVVVSMNIF